MKVRLSSERLVWLCSETPLRYGAAAVESFQMLEIFDFGFMVASLL